MTTSEERIATLEARLEAQEKAMAECKALQVERHKSTEKSIAGLRRLLYTVLIAVLASGGGAIAAALLTK
jgi:uncharacterized coiled-coil protein SlyX